MKEKLKNEPESSPTCNPNSVVNKRVINRLSCFNASLERVTNYTQCYPNNTSDRMLNKGSVGLDSLVNAEKDKKLSNEKSNKNDNIIVNNDQVICSELSPKHLFYRKTPSPYNPLGKQIDKRLFSSNYNLEEVRDKRLCHPSNIIYESLNYQSFSSDSLLIGEKRKNQMSANNELCEQIGSSDKMKYLNMFYGPEINNLRFSSDIRHRKIYESIISQINSCNESVVDSKLPIHLRFNKPENTMLWRMRKSYDFLAGYNPLRGSFDVEFDNNAEELITIGCDLNYYENLESHQISFDEKDLLQNIQFALGDIYNSRLIERQRRKKIIQEHGLMNQHGNHLWFTKLESEHGKQTSKKLIRFSQLLTYEELESLCASLAYLYECRAEVNKLIFFRVQRGISSRMDVVLYEKERKKRESSEERVDIRNLVGPSTVKRRKVSINIFHLPRYKELTPAEADLCSGNGIMPDIYLNIKDVLITDCKKCTGMPLKKARKLAKIDVNKTRLIYDHLMEEGLIWPLEKKL